MAKSLEQRLAEHHGALTDTLRNAADFLVANPVDVATRPLRKVSADSNVSPAAYTRLARALKYQSFDELREELRGKIGQRVNTFADKAEQLQKAHGADNAGFMAAHLAACRSNLELIEAQVDQAQLDIAADRLIGADHVFLHGALGSTGIVEYMSYMAGFCADNWVLLNRSGASLGSGLAKLTDRDVLIVVTKPPFAPKVINSARFAKTRGAFVIVITDTHTCPALSNADVAFVLPTDSPHFYSSYVSALFLTEALIGTFVSRSGVEVQHRIAKVQQTNHLLSEVFDG